SATTEVKMDAGLAFESALSVAAELKTANSVATSLRVCIACASRRRASVGGDCLFTPVILLTRRHIAVSTSHGKHRFACHATSLRCPDTSRRCDGARPQAQFGYESRARAPAYQVAYRRSCPGRSDERYELTRAAAARSRTTCKAGRQETCL